MPSLRAFVGCRVNDLYKGLKIKSGARKFDDVTKELHAKLHNDLISLND